MDERSRFFIGGSLVVIGLLAGLTLMVTFTPGALFVSALCLVGGVFLVRSALPAGDDDDALRRAGALLAPGELDGLIGPFGPEHALRRVSDAAQACAMPATRALRIALIPSPLDPERLIDFELRSEPENTLSGAHADALKQAVDDLGLARANAVAAPVAFTMVGVRGTDGAWTWSYSAT